MIDSIARSYLSLKEQNPHIYPRNAARQLNVSELQILPHTGLTYICDLDPVHIFQGAMESGTLINRNDYLVLESMGEIKVDALESADNRRYIFRAGQGMAELQLELSVYHIDETNKRRSIQFFDASGHASLKIFLNHGERIHEAILAEDPKFLIESELYTELSACNVEPRSYPEQSVFLRSVENLLADMSIPEDQKNKIHQVCQNPQWNHSEGRLRNIIEIAVAKEQPIALFCSTAKSIHGFAGKVYSAIDARGFFNILDQGFNMHCKLDLIKQEFVIQDGDFQVLLLSDYEAMSMVCLLPGDDRQR